MKLEVHIRRVDRQILEQVLSNLGGEAVAVEVNMEVGYCNQAKIPPNKHLAYSFATHSMACHHRVV